MEPANALNAIETALRNAIYVVFPRSEWLEAAGAPEREGLERKRVEEAKRRDGHIPPASLLDFAYTHELEGIVLKNWEKFKPIFDDQARMRTYFEVIDDVRNAIAHSRPLVQFERDLIAGIAGQLGNQVSVYSSRRDGSRDFYPTIESLRDGFGSDARATAWEFEGSARQRPSVGHVLHFSGKAADPRGRGVSWYLIREGRSLTQGEELYRKIGEGEVLEYDYDIEVNDVRERFDVRIILIGNWSFHRNADGVSGVRLSYDDEGCFGYSVNPPEIEYPPIYPSIQ
ncbi:MAG TPA: hypothetical protein VMV41_13355 [Cellulomonadaceae bacterium]|nr:hypothetical protein [Cellulomonadaceae bacterium]